MAFLDIFLYMAAAVAFLLAVLAPGIGIKHQGCLIAAGLLFAVLVHLISLAQQVHG